MRFKYTLIALLLLGTSSVYASGWAFMGIPQSTREVAIGETGVSHASGGSAIWWNPAHAARTLTGAWFQSYNWISDGKGNYGGMNFASDRGGLSLSYTSHSMEGFEARSRPGDPEGNFTLHQTVIALSGAYRILEKLSVGMTYKTAYEDIYGDQMQDWNIFDVGAIWYEDLFNLGFSVANMKSIALDDATYPTTFRLGASHEHTINEFDILLSAESHVTTEDDAYYHFGTEVGWKDMFYLRGGYMAGHDSKSFSTGLGLHYKYITADFSYTPFDNSLGDTWRAGLGLRL